MKPSAKRVTGILSVFLLLFTVYNLFWMTVVGAVYRDFLPGTKEVYPLRTYAIDDLDGYTFNVKIPDYLSFTGNLGVQPKEGGQCALIIWPGIFRKTRYGVFLPVGGGGFYGVYVTENGEALPDAPERIRRLVEENREAIDELFARADALWDY